MDSWQSHDLYRSRTHVWGLHVRSVLADYLDNDEDGIADNPRVVFALREGKAVAAVFDTFREYEGFDDRNGYRTAQPFELVTMMQEETDTSYGFDASLEKVLHLVALTPDFGPE